MTKDNDAAQWCSKWAKEAALTFSYSAWLLELPQQHTDGPVYFYAGYSLRNLGEPARQWTTDAREAIRFVSKEHAEAFRDAGVGNVPPFAKAVEHRWVVVDDAATAQAARIAYEGHLREVALREALLKLTDATEDFFGGKTASSMAIFKAGNEAKNLLLPANPPAVAPGNSERQGSQR